MNESEKQGKIGDLDMKTSPELEELMRRQTKILANIQFISKLPDKGERLQFLVKRLQAELNSRKDVDATADLFHQMALNAEKANRERGALNQGENQMDDDDTEEESGDTLKNIINRASDEKKIIDNRTNPSSTYVNSYERVIKGNKPQNTKLKKKFYAHKTVKAENVKELSMSEFTVEKDVVSIDSSPPPLEMPSETEIISPADTKAINKESQQRTPTKLNNENKHSAMEENSNSSSPNPGTSIGHKSENPNLKHRYDDSLEMSIYSPSRKYGGVKLISIEDSIEVYETQKKKQETLMAEQAGRRLAQKLGVKMADFEPKQFEMRYRDKAGAKDSESDSDPDTDGELDYPD